MQLSSATRAHPLATAHICEAAFFRDDLALPGGTVRLSTRFEVPAWIGANLLFRTLLLEATTIRFRQFASLTHLVNTPAGIVQDATTFQTDSLTIASITEAAFREWVETACPVHNITLSARRLQLTPDSRTESFLVASIGKAAKSRPPQAASIGHLEKSVTNSNTSTTLSTHFLLFAPVLVAALSKSNPLAVC